MRLTNDLLPALLNLQFAFSTPPPQQPLQPSKAKPVSPALFTELATLARVVDITYCIHPLNYGLHKPFTCLSHCSAFPSFELVTTWNTGPLLSDSCGYVALDHAKERIVVAFRGTYSLVNTVVDLSSGAQDYIPYDPEDEDAGKEQDKGLGTRQHIFGGQRRLRCENCTVHTGFHRAWLNTRSVLLPALSEQLLVYPHYELHLLGHSLGGAVAALAALDLHARGWEPVVTTFGEPRVGNRALAKYVDEIFNLTDVQNGDVAERAESEAEGEGEGRRRYRRVTHVDDPVPLLPLSEWGFAAHAGEIFISKSALEPEAGDMHFCEGHVDQSCIAGQDSTTTSSSDAPGSGQGKEHEVPQVRKRDGNDLIASVANELEDVRTESWGVPARYKLWRLFWAHRDYFLRLGICAPGGDPSGSGRWADVGKAWTGI